MNEQILMSIIFGMAGGLIRGLIGFVKFFQQNHKDKSLKLWATTFSALVAALVGGVAGALAGGDWRLAVVVGYAGTDFIESLYKIKKKQGLEI